MKLMVDGQEFNAGNVEEIINWVVGKETDPFFFWESLLSVRGGRFILASERWEKDYRNPQTTVKFIKAKAVWPLLAAKNADPNRLSMFYRTSLRVMKGERLVGIMHLAEEFQSPSPQSRQPPKQ